MSRPPEVDLFFQNEAPRVLGRLFSKVRMADFTHCKVLLNDRMRKYFADNGISLDDPRFTWGSDCNTKTLSLLKRLEDDGRIKIKHELDGGIFGDGKKMMKPIYDGFHFDSVKAKLELSGFCRAFIDEFDGLVRKTRPLYFAEKSAKRCTTFHNAEGSEILSGLLTLASVFVSLEVSSSKKAQDMARQWKLLPLPRSMKSYFEGYAGDALCKVEPAPITICTPYVLKHWNGKSRVESFFQRLFKKLENEHFFICLPFGFQLCPTLPWSPMEACPFFREINGLGPIVRKRRCRK